MSRLVGAAPDVLPLVLLAFVLPVGLAVTFGWHTPWFVLPAATGLALVLWRLRPKEAITGSLADGAALVAILLWVAVQLAYTGEYVTVDRDPAVYALTGVWLIDNPQVAVPTAEAAQVAAGVDGARTAGLGFGGTRATLSPEFAHTLPGLAALGGWLGGVGGVLASNVVIAGVTLLAVYGVGRRCVGAWWALLPVVGLAVAMPYVAFARNLYAEPLALGLAAAGVSTLMAVTRQADTAGAWRGSLLAGLFVGAAGLVRIDGGLLVIGAIVAVACWAVVDGLPRRVAATHLVAVAAPAATLVGLGVLDVARNSGTYLERHAPQTLAVTAGIAAGALLGVVLVGFGPPLHAWLRASGVRVASIAAGFVGAASLLLLSRPLWYEARFFASAPRYARDVERRQREEGLRLDGARSYDELTLEWVAWYQGWPAVLLGLAGLSLLTWLALARRSDVVVVVATFGVPALVYVVHPAITPDHVWAMRRLTLAAVPLLLLASAAVLAHLAHLRRARAVGAVLAGAGALVVVVWPLTGWSGLHPVRDRVGQLAEAEAVCSQIPDGRVVIAGGVPGVDYLPTARILCDAQVVALAQPTQESLAALHAGWGGLPLALITYQPDEVAWTRPAVDPVLPVQLEMWERSLIDPPQDVTLWRRTLWSGVVQADGSVEPR